MTTTDTVQSSAIPIGGLPRTRNRGRRVLVSLGYSVLPVIVLLLLWNPFFPAPSAIIGNLFTRGLAENWLMRDLLPSLGRIALGALFGSLWGVALGVWMGLRGSVRATVSPAVEFLRSIPATAVLPLFIVLFGGGDDMRVIFIAYGVSWYVLINTIAGVRSVDPAAVNMARSFRVSGPRIVFRVVIPAALPKIFAGFRIASTAALLLAIVSEFMLSTNGIGYQLIQTQARFQLLDMWSWMLVLAVLGLIINFTLEAVEHRVLRWHIGATARS